ncbi:MAG: oligosaccharide flippase family protein, partial [Acidobacteriota bacterium]
MLPDSTDLEPALSKDRPAPFQAVPHRPLARSAFHLVLGQGATTVLAVLLTGAIGRALGPADFGSWYLLTTTTGFAYVFVDWGYANYVIGEIARRPNRAGELAGTVLALRALTAVVVCVPAIFSAWLLGHGARMCELVVLNIAASMPMYLLTSFTWALRARERMDLDAAISVVLKLLMVVVTVAALAADLRLPGVILAQGVAGAMAFAVAWRLYQRAGLTRLRAPVV